MHRRKLCDAYIVAYWVYKYKLPFTTSGKLKEVSLKRYLLSGMKCRLNIRMFRVESRQPNWALYIHPNNFNI